MNYLNSNLSATHPGWLIAMVVGFVAWWPIGLIVLAYIIWSNSMAKVNGGLVERVKGVLGLSSDNTAFANYKAAALDKLEAQRQRLEDEEQAFRRFIDKARMARDKQAFDEFLRERGQV